MVRVYALPKHAIRDEGVVIDVRADRPPSRHTGSLTNIQAAVRPMPSVRAVQASGSRVVGGHCRPVA